MAYRFGRDESVAEGARRIVSEQLLVASSLLGGEGQVGTVVHDARTHLKMARAVLELTRSAIPTKAFRRERRRYRDAGRALAAVRDARVLVDTLDGLRASAPEMLEGAAVTGVRRVLRAEVVTAQRALRKGEVRKVVASELESAARRAQALPIEDEGWSTLARGLKRIYAGGAKAQQSARERGSDEAFHAWRARAKELWYCERLLRSVWPGVMRSRAKTSGELGDLLGRDHDLALLRARLSEDPGRFGDSDGTALLVEASQRASCGLRERAQQVAARVYAEAASDYVARLGAYFAGWRGEVS